jgi:hypothetical protein
MIRYVSWFIIPDNDLTLLLSLLYNISSWLVFHGPFLDSVYCTYLKYLLYVHNY